MSFASCHTVMMLVWALQGKVFFLGSKQFHMASKSICARMSFLGLPSAPVCGAGEPLVERHLAHQ